LTASTARVTGERRELEEVHVGPLMRSVARPNEKETPMIITLVLNAALCALLATGVVHMLARSIWSAGADRRDARAPRTTITGARSQRGRSRVGLRSEVATR